jgi:uncharacterized membrane protein
MKTIISFLAAGLTFSVLDYIWLAHVAKKFYLEKLAPLVTIKDGSLVVNYAGAAVFYVLALVATYIFAVRGATSQMQAIYSGATLGFFMYAFYDMTNYATLKNWSLQLSIVDIIWGTFLMSAVAGVMYFVKSF